MSNKIIERYIQFAIDNWMSMRVNWDLITFNKFDYYQTWRVILRLNNISLDCDLFALITSKEFIEAVARWIYMWNNPVRVKIDNIFNQIIDNITTEQSIAIRDKKLEDFILEILK